MSKSLYTIIHNKYELSLINFYFIYSCADGDNDVLFLYNEKPLVIPGCQSNGLCKVNYILAKYSRYLTANCASTYCTK